MDSSRKIQIEDDSDDCDDSGRIPTQSDQPRGSMTRKRRRGIIEKRRRDRINNCLSELKRLVPAAFEKQGSQKLEKAEILQMTVEHLRFVHSKGADSLLYDSQRYASDYHSMGFRDCAGEVARYLSMVEGMELQDPVRLRLLSHLQSCNAQRIASTINPWTTQYTGNANSWPATASSVPKFEPTPVQYSSPYASLPTVDVSNNNGYSNGNLNTVHYPSAPVVSVANQAHSLTSLRAPMAGSFQPVGNGSATGLNLNLTFLAPATTSNGPAMTSNLDKIGYGRNGWNASDNAY